MKYGQRSMRIMPQKHVWPFMDCDRQVSPKNAWNEILKSFGKRINVSLLLL